MPTIDFTQAIQLAVILLISIDLHELAHAVVADRLGDPTPRRNGQISLNPLVHMDQIGVLVLAIAALAGFGLAWGRTFVQPQNLKFGPQRGGAIVAAAGPLTNLLLAIVLAVGLRWAETLGCGTPLGVTSPHFQAAAFVNLAVLVNLTLFFFNLIPVPPLDGFTIISGFLTTRQLYSLTPVIQYGPMILMLVILLSFSGVPIFQDTIQAAVGQIGSSILPGFPDFLQTCPP